MEEFLVLIEEKIEVEQQKVNILKRIGNFEIDHLMSTPFTEIVEGIKRKSMNEIS